jgi:SNF2 family DNA or RNA helicase
MSKQQRDMYEELQRELLIELGDGRVVDGSMALTMLLRLQQITSGYVGTGHDEPDHVIPGPNPRLDSTIGFCDGLNHPAIIWCRFKHDIDLLMDALGKNAVRYDGTLDEDEAERSKQMFNAGDAQWFVGNAKKGGEGLTINAAKTTMFYSNMFELIKRLQAEDRNHRIGQEGAIHSQMDGQLGVLYADVCGIGTVDMKIISHLREGFDIASELTGDGLREWI